MRYRTDLRTGQRTGILPLTCRAGRHILAGPDRYLVTVAGDDLLAIMCLACRDDGVPRDSWVLRHYGPQPDRVVLDDTPYQDIGHSPIFERSPVFRPPHRK